MAFAAMDGALVRFEASSLLAGCHFRVQEPELYGREYNNRKLYPSINVMALCDATTFILGVDISQAGSVNDAGVYNKSKIKHSLEEELLPTLESLGRNLGVEGHQHFVRPHVIADHIYAHTEHVQQEYPNPTGKRPHETNWSAAYSWAFKRARLAIEHCFGLLKGRWRFLRHCLPMQPKRQGKQPATLLEEEPEFSEHVHAAHRRWHSRCCTAILMGCVLHNFCLLQGDIAVPVRLAHVCVTACCRPGESRTLMERNAAAHQSKMQHQTQRQHP